MMTPTPAALRHGRGMAATALLAATLMLLTGCGGYSAKVSAEAWQPYQPVTQGAGGGQAYRQVEAEERSRHSVVATSSSPRTESTRPSPKPRAPQPSPPSADDSDREPAPKRRPQSRPPPTPPASGAAQGGQSQASGGDGSAAEGADGGGKDEAPDDDEDDKPADAKARDVVYLGYLRLEVKHRVDALQAIEAEAKKRGGYIDRMAGNTVVLRVPAGDFDEAMAAFGELGKVLDRRIQALDVTDQVTDLAGRLAVLKDARERLLLLLARATRVEERLQLLAQIKRLSNDIEGIESSLTTLRDLVAWQTITIEIVAQAEDGRGVMRRSPFPWVRALSPGRPGPGGSADRVQAPAIEGFVALRDAEPFTARAADSSALHIYAVPNDPRGDATFWHRAIAWELEGRGDRKLEVGSTGAWQWQLWQSREPRPWTWLLAVRVEGDNVWVYAAFLPDLAALKRHQAALQAGLGAVEVKP